MRLLTLSKAGLQGWPWLASANLRFHEGWGHSQNSQGWFTMTTFTQHGLCWTCALLSEDLKCWCTWDRRHSHDQSQQKLAHWVSNGLPWHITFQAHILICFWGISDSWKLACGFLYTLSMCLFFFCICFLIPSLSWIQFCFPYAEAWCPPELSNLGWL